MMEKLDVRITGIMLNYYYVCHRKLWLYANYLNMEHTSERVKLGEILHEDSFKDFEEKELIFDNLICIDIKDEDYIHEVKISDKMIQPGVMQIAYYLYYLKSFGIIKKGTIRYPLQKKVLEVELTKDLEEELKRAMEDIKRILSLEKPPKIEEKPYCKKCAYFEFCFVD